MGCFTMSWTRNCFFCSPRHKISRVFYSPPVSQIPERHGSQEFLRLLLNKLNFPASSVSIVVCSTKTSLSQGGQAENDCRREERLAGAGNLVTTFLALNWQEAEGWWSGCGVVYPIPLQFGTEILFHTPEASPF